jgi:hypothetical protein
MYLASKLLTGRNYFSYLSIKSTSLIPFIVHSTSCRNFPHGKDFRISRIPKLHTKGYSSAPLKKSAKKAEIDHKSSTITTLKQLMGYLWPQGEYGLKFRVISAAALLIGAKVIF